MLNRWRGVLAGVVLAACAATLALAQEDKSYPDGPDGLKQLWTDVLAKAQAGDEDGVRGMLERMVMAEGDFAAVFGDDKAADINTKYAEKYAKHWPNEAKNITAKVRERSYDDVEVTEVTGAPDQQSGDDKKVAGALKEGTKMYSVRLKKKGEKAGLRYDSFFHVNGAWKTGLKLGKLLGDAKTAGK